MSNQMRKIFAVMGLTLIDEDINGLVAACCSEEIYLCEVEITDEPLEMDLPDKTKRLDFELAIADLMLRHHDKLPINVPIKYAHVQVHVLTDDRAIIKMCTKSWQEV